MSNQELVEALGHMTPEQTARLAAWVKASVVTLLPDAKAILAQPDHDAARLIAARVQADDRWTTAAVRALRGKTGDKYLESFAAQLSHGAVLTGRQLAVARRRCSRHAVRLLRIARGR